MKITAQMVKELRAATNAGVMDCKKALQDADGDMVKAAEIVREQGLSIAAKKSEREVKAGLIGHYVHAGSRVAALIEINCETDFVERTQAFQDLAHDLAMQVVAAKPLYVAPEDIPAEVLEQEMSAFRAEMEGTNKPANMMDRIIEGKLAKYYDTVCLMEQPYIKDGDIKVKDLVTAKIAEVKENIVVRRFARLELGEEG